MPAGMSEVLIVCIWTVVPCLAGTNTSVDHVGWFMWPGNGGVTDGVGRMSQAGCPIAVAAASPWRWRVTVLLNASLRETVKFGPLTGVTVVDGTVIAAGGLIAKSGICITVPLYTP